MNRKLVKIFSAGLELLYNVLNPLKCKPLFFISDVLHLIKTTRNCWASKARYLWVC